MHRKILYNRIIQSKFIKKVTRKQVYYYIELYKY